MIWWVFLKFDAVSMLTPNLQGGRACQEIVRAEFHFWWANLVVKGECWLAELKWSTYRFVLCFRLVNRHVVNYFVDFRPLFGIFERWRLHCIVDNFLVIAQLIDNDLPLVMNWIELRSYLAHLEVAGGSITWIVALAHQYFHVAEGFVNLCTEWLADTPLPIYQSRFCNIPFYKTLYFL